GSAERRNAYGDIMPMLKEGYTETDEYLKYATYLSEAFGGGAEIVRLGRMVSNIDIEGNSREQLDAILEGQFKNFYKDYEPDLDRKVLAAMLQIVKERVPAAYLPDIYPKIDKKYKGNYAKYADEVFKKTQILTYDRLAALMKDKKAFNKMMKEDPAVELAESAIIEIISMQQLLGSQYYEISKAERLHQAALKEMHPDKTFYSDANFTMRMSYGSVGGYRPFDAVWYDYYSTVKGVLEKEDPTDDEFWVQPEIIDLLKSKNYSPYADANGELYACFLTNNDITGGNSGSPVFDGQGRLIGLAFDGNWEAMSGDIAFEPELQRCIAVDIRYLLYMMDKWAKCPRLIEELKLSPAI
ncbi:MAG: S46 family peptidase, partial [Tannerella sp.]|nr:S46 family peptidase [Tannerella sp.]